MSRGTSVNQIYFKIQNVMSILQQKEMVYRSRVGYS